VAILTSNEFFNDAADFCGRGTGNERRSVSSSSFCLTAGSGLSNCSQNLIFAESP